MIICDLKKSAEDRVWTSSGEHPQAPECRHQRIQG